MKKILKENRFLVYCVFLGIVLFSISFYRSLVSSITYDEAFTYMNYVYDNPLKVFKSLFIEGTWANNHVLNSFLISIINSIFKFKYCEILIRVPNLFFYIVYLVFGYLLANKYKNKYIFFSILALNYGVNEYFGLARGYGMSCALVLVGLYFLKLYIEEKSKKNFLLISYTSLMLACYANTVALIIYAAVLLVTVIKLIQNKELVVFIKKKIIYLIIIGLGSLVIMRYHFLISSDGLPLFGGSTGFFTDVLVSIFSMYGFSNSNEWTCFILGILFTIIIINKNKLFKNPIFFICPVYFVIFILSIKITDNMWLTQRCLIPTWPLVLVFIAEILEYINFEKIIPKFTLITFLVFIFYKNYNIESYRDWMGDYMIKDVAYEVLKKEKCELLQPYSDNYVTLFYKEKISLYYNKDINCK